MSQQAPGAKDHQQATYQVPWWLHWRRLFLRWLFRGIFHLLCHVEITGLEHIPQQGGYIIAHNHISLFEPPLVLSFWPEVPEAVAGADVFHRPGQKIMVRAYGAIPVHRGEYDREVIDVMMDVLRSGRSLMIAPEGGRGHKPALRRGLAGVAYLMDRAGVPVVPVGLVGTTDDMLARALRFERPHLQMKIGQPFTLPPITGRGQARRQMRQANADLVMLRIADLLPESYRGVYANS